MINRLFLYSKEEAEKNKCFANFGKSIFGILLLIIISSIILALISGINVILCMIVSCFMIIILIYFTINIIKKNVIMREVFAIDDMGRIFKVAKSIYYHNTSRSAIGAIFSMIDYFCDTTFFVNNITNDIDKYIEDPASLYNINVFKLLNVYDYSENNKYYKFKCDIKNLKNGNLICNDILIIYKAYICHEELVNILLNSPLYKK